MLLDGLTNTNHTIMAKSKLSPKSDPFAREQVVRLSTPFPLWNLCKLLEVTPIQIVDDLFKNIGSPVKFGSFGETTANQEATEFFLRQGYGREYYTKDEVRQMIAELGIVEGIIPPFDSSYDKIFNDYIRMRDVYLRVWKSKWEDQKKRKPLV